MLLQSSPPDLGSVGLNIAAYLLVIIGTITTILLCHIYKKIDQRLATVEQRQWKDGRQTQENKDNILKHYEILQEIRNYSRKIDKRIDEDMEPRLRYVEREVHKRG